MPRPCVALGDAAHDLARMSVFSLRLAGVQRLDDGVEVDLRLPVAGSMARTSSSKVIMPTESCCRTARNARHAAAVQA